jgi:hypothetical protein
MEEKYRPFATKLREDLYRNLKLLAAAEDKPIQTLLEEAVEQFLEDHKFSARPPEVREGGTRYSLSFEVPDPKKRKPRV